MTGNDRGKTEQRVNAECHENVSFLSPAGRAATSELHVSAQGVQRGGKFQVNSWKLSILEIIEIFKNFMGIIEMNGN